MTLKCAISYSARNALAMREAERIWRLNTGRVPTGPVSVGEKSASSGDNDPVIDLWKRGHIKLVVTKDQFVHIMQLTT